MCGTLPRCVPLDQCTRLLGLIIVALFCSMVRRIRISPPGKILLRNPCCSRYVMGSTLSGVCWPSRQILYARMDRHNAYWNSFWGNSRYGNAFLSGEPQEYSVHNPQHEFHRTLLLLLVLQTATVWSWRHRSILAPLGMVCWLVAAPGIDPATVSQVAANTWIKRHTRQCVRFEVCGTIHLMRSIFSRCKSYASDVRLS